ncbi:MAG: hypothetical protein ACR2PT_22150 [Endozoicomonas sp.]
MQPFPPPPASKFERINRQEQHTGRPKTNQHDRPGTTGDAFGHTITSGATKGSTFLTSADQNQSHALSPSHTGRRDTSSGVKKPMAIVQPVLTDSSGKVIVDAARGEKTHDHQYAIYLDQIHHYFEKIPSESCRATPDSDLTVHFPQHIQDIFKKNSTAHQELRDTLTRIVNKAIEETSNQSMSTTQHINRLKKLHKLISHFDIQLPGEVKFNFDETLATVMAQVGLYEEAQKHLSRAVTPHSNEVKNMLFALSILEQWHGNAISPVKLKRDEAALPKFEIGSDLEHSTTKENMRKYNAAYFNSQLAQDIREQWMVYRFRSGAKLDELRTIRTYLHNTASKFFVNCCKILDHLTVHGLESLLDQSELIKERLIELQTLYSKKLSCCPYEVGRQGTIENAFNALSKSRREFKNEICSQLHRLVTDDSEHTKNIRLKHAEMTHRQLQILQQSGVEWDRFNETQQSMLMKFEGMYLLNNRRFLEHEEFQKKCTSRRGSIEEAQLLNSMVQALILQKRYSETVPLLQRITACTVPEAADTARIKLAKHYWHQSEIEKSSSILEKVTDKSSNSYFGQLSLNLKSEGKLDESLEALQKIRLTPIKDVENIKRFESQLCYDHYTFHKRMAFLLSSYVSKSEPILIQSDQYTREELIDEALCHATLAQYYHLAEEKEDLTELIDNLRVLSIFQEEP